MDINDFERCWGNIKNFKEKIEMMWKRAAKEIKSGYVVFDKGIPLRIRKYLDPKEDIDIVEPSLGIFGVT